MKEAMKVGAALVAIIAMFVWDWERALTTALIVGAIQALQFIFVDRLEIRAVRQAAEAAYSRQNGNPPE